MPENRETAPLTPNQVVAYNLIRARQLRGLSQEEAAERLEPYLGTRWSKATFSAAERSLYSERVREFTADDIVALARAFDLPVTFFLIPPPPDAVGREALVWVPDLAPTHALTPPQFVEIVFGTAGISERLGELFGDETHAPAFPIEYETETQQQLGVMARLMAGAVIKSRTKDLTVWRQNLLDLAGLLEDIDRQVDEGVLKEVARKKKAGKR